MSAASRPVRIGSEIELGNCFVVIAPRDEELGSGDLAEVEGLSSPEILNER